MTCSREQTMSALELANEIRLEGMKFRREVGRMEPIDGRIALAKTLEHNGFEPGVGALRIRRFLTAARLVGPQKAEGMCRDAGVVRTDPRVRDLTLGERSRLAKVLRRRAHAIKVGW
jgi:hypothetical protein